MTSIENEEDNYVEYFVYPRSGEANQERLDEIYLFLFPLLKDYIWHLEPFNLRLKGDHFHGKICFGENIVDEWFLVHLCMEMTRQFPDLVIRVIDNDGEFPLIEAAEVIPKWAGRPEITQGRVYIHEESLHLIPIALNPSQLTPFPSGPISKIDQAVHAVRSLASTTRASPGVQKCLTDKLEETCCNLKNVFHHKTVLIPKTLASVLHQRPELISPAVHSFVNRDSMDKKALRGRTYFPIEQKDNLVKFRAKFTRLLFAILDSQKFYPEKKSKEKDVDLLSLKLTSAFEILASRSRQKNSQDKDHHLSPEYQLFEKKLVEKGYFDNLLPGSKDYLFLRNKSINFFQENIESKESRYSEDLMSIIQNSDLAETVPEYSHEEDDDESWLTVDKESFEELLKRQFSGSSSYKMSDDSRIPSELKSFFSQMSGFEGIDAKEGPSDENNGIQFNPEELESKLKHMFQTNDDSFDEDSEEEEEPPEMKEYFEALEEELYSSKVEPIREKKNVSSKEELEAELKKPMDIDYTVFKNLLKSYENEDWSSGGPTSTLLKSFKM